MEANLGDNEDLWTQVGGKEERAVEGRVKGPPEVGVSVGGGVALASPRLVGRSGKWSPHIASAGRRTGSQAPAGEIVNSSGRVGGRIL